VNWPPARNAIKYAVHGAAEARGQLLRRRHQVPALANIFAMSPPKAGSQWAKALFDHPVVRAHTGLFTLPQLDYQRRRRALPPGTFVPGMYLSHEEYDRLEKPYPFRAFYIMRDPRDLAVSAYYSAVETHRPVPEYEDLRVRMRQAQLRDGLLMAIDLVTPRLHDMESWIGVTDPRVAFCRLEEIGSDHEGQVRRILAHCGVELSPAELQTVVQETSRESLQRKDLASRESGSESHYRKDRRSFRDLFEDQHYEALEKAAPGLVARLGYE
jgi:hypothetical protein